MKTLFYTTSGVIGTPVNACYKFIVLFIIFGNYLPKTKQSYSMGIKLPWTLNSEENWNRTHRLSGFLWVIGGALFLMLTFFGWWNLYVLLGIVLAMALIPTVYSYLLYRKGI